MQQHPVLRAWILSLILITPIFASCDSGSNSSESEDPMEVEVSVMGTVTSSSGEPVEGASVEIKLPDDETSLASTSTDKTGSYEATFTVAEENAPNQLLLTFTAGEFMNEQVTVGFSTDIQLDVTLEKITPESLGSEASISR